MGKYSYHNVIEEKKGCLYIGFDPGEQVDEDSDIDCTTPEECDGSIVCQHCGGICVIGGDLLDASKYFRYCPMCGKLL